MFDIPKTMRAVVYRGPNDLRVETVPVPRLRPNELLVKVAVCGVCPTDIKKIQYGTVPPPRIFGHETAGTIVQVGRQPAAGSRQKAHSALRTQRSEFRIGDRVALHHHVPCLDCHFCRHRAFAQCAHYKRTGVTAGFEPAGGGFAEYVRVLPFALPGVVKIPARNSFEEGAMLEPVNTVLKAVNRLNLLSGDAVLVAGQGPIGLMFTKILQLRGLKVLATDLLETRLKLAKKFGARWIFPGRAGSPGHPPAVMPDLPRPPKLLDAAVIAVPSDAAVMQAMPRVRGGGQILLFAHTKRAGQAGRVTPCAPLEKSEVTLKHRAAISLSAADGGEGRGEVVPSGFQLDLASICMDEKDLIGSYSSDFTLQPEVARLVFSRRFDVRPLITHRFSLEHASEAIALAAHPTPDSLKIMIQPGGAK